MDDLDRVFHRLVSNVRHRHPEYLTLPFTVQELYETLIPYRHHRRELGIETNQDYEIAMTRLLSGERDYLQTDSSMREKLESELMSPNADTGAFREFAASKVSLAPEALRRIRSLTAAGAEAPAGPTAASAASAPSSPESASTTGTAGVPAPQASAASAPAAAPGITATFPVSSPSLTAPSEPARPELPPFESLMQVAVPEGCRFCGGTLPEGRNVVYCPHCGNDLSISRCPACGSELEKGWKFCTTCGRSVGA